VKTLTDYLTNDVLKKKINQAQVKINSTAKLQSLATDLIHLLYDKNDQDGFLRMLGENREIISRALGADAADCFAAAVFDKHFDRLRDIYTRRNIPETILAATMQDFNLWADCYAAQHGRVGIGDTDWLISHMTGELFQLGRLQFMMNETHDGAPALDIHIPASGKLDIDACKRSMEWAVQFAKSHFPERNYKALTLSCWLLGDEIKEILPPESNILQFAALFTRTGEGGGTHPVIYQFLFGFDKHKTDFAQHIAQTTLQKGAHRLLRENRWFTEQFGVILI